MKTKKELVLPISFLSNHFPSFCNLLVHKYFQHGKHLPPSFITHPFTVQTLGTVFPLIEAGSQIQAGFLIEAGGQTSFLLIEAGSLIQAESLTEAGGLKANIIELIAHTPVALWCIASFLRIA